MMEELFVITTPGLESITKNELIELGYPICFIEPGGITFQGEISDLYRCNYNLRTASRILVRLGSFHAAAFSELRKKASRLIWEKYIQPDQTVTIKSTSHKSRLYHSDAVNERLYGAIADRLGSVKKSIAADEPGEIPESQQIFARLINNVCTISIDSSGDLLHRRGYRLAGSKAPLRENLAAAMILASGWDGLSPLVDPFCGSGTIPIEAALIAQGIPSGKNRKFAFMNWPDFDVNHWNKITHESDYLISSKYPVIFGSDRDSGAIQTSVKNAERAEVSQYIQFECKSLSALTPPPGIGFLVTNPPYGLRISSSQDIRNLYSQIGNIAQYKLAGWKLAVLGSNLHLLTRMKVNLDTSIKFKNGGIDVILGQGTISKDD